MAIAKMVKVLIVSHRSEAAELLEILQTEGICQILSSEEAKVSRDWPDLGTAAERPKDIENLLARLTKSMAFLKDYAELPKGLVSALAPRSVVNEQSYNQVVSDRQILNNLEQCEQVEATIEGLKAKIENIGIVLEELQPWVSLETPVQDIGPLRQTISLAALIPADSFQQVEEKIGELGGVLQRVGLADNKYACIIVCLNANINDIQQQLRSAEFEQVSFGEMTGTAEQLIEQHKKELDETQSQLEKLCRNAVSLAQNFLKIQILCDHYSNLLNREQTKSTAPATEQTVIFEGWTREKDYPALEKIVSKLNASNLIRIEPAEGEEVPVEIENRNIIRPFEVVTRLYGMPQHFEVDPTALLAPFFVLFFALCLTDVGYGLIILAFTAYLIKKMQGDKKLIWMLCICSVMTMGAGALTGGWFGDGVQQLSAAFGWTWLAKARESMMWFDPMKEPMVFFRLSLVLGYVHIMVAIMVAFLHNLKQKKIIAAVCDQLTWLVMLNSIVLKLFGTGFGLSPEFAAVFGKIAMVPAVIIVLFSQRHGNWAGRIGMGCYQLFSTIFYMGDVLSYLRLMALGMVTGGLAMAFNVMAKTAIEGGTIKGYIIMGIILVVGHLFNTAISGLSAFVHTIRLQFVEFFPKFLEGGGTLFKPLTKEYKHVYISEKTG